ncbi:hypothetical protein U1Q18_028949 [Sarracenia purpurea var. burkii]
MMNAHFGKACKSACVPDRAQGDKATREGEGVEKAKMEEKEGEVGMGRAMMEVLEKEMVGRANMVMVAKEERAILEKEVVAGVEAIGVEVGIGEKEATDEQMEGKKGKKTWRN